MAVDLRLAGEQRQSRCLPENLLAAGEGELVDQFYLLSLGGVVLDFGLDEDRVAGGIVPDVDAKGFDAYGIGLDEADGPEDAEGLAALAESPFRRASATDPW